MRYLGRTTLVIQHTRELLASSLVEGHTGRSSRQAILKYIKDIGALVDKPGITSWLACRILAPFLTNALRGPSGRNLRLLITDKSHDVLKKARVLFAARQGIGLQSIVSEPVALLAERGKPAVPIQDLLLEFLHQGDSTHLDWIRRMTVPATHIRPIIEACPEINSHLLAKLVDLRFQLTSARRPMKIAQIQKILAIARRSDDERVLAGAITAIAGSKFLRVSGVDLLLKMLANRLKGKSMALLVFREPSQLESREEFLIVQLLAKSIMQEPKRFDFYTVLAAATFWAEHARRKLPTLTASDGTIVSPTASS